MAPKLKKKNSNNGEKATELWPDLPQQLIKMISWQSTLMQNIGDGGVTKSWRSLSKQCNQTSKPPIWLQLHDDRGNNVHDTNFKMNIKFHRGEWIWYPRRRWPEPWEYYEGFSEGATVAKGVCSRKLAEGESSPTVYYQIYYPHGCKSFYSLPPWDPMVPFRHPVVSSCSEKSVMMVLTGITHPAFAFCRLRGRGYREINAWTKQDCTIPDPHCSSEKQNFMRFTNVIGYQGKFFALSLQGALAVIEPDVDSSDLKITALGPKRAVPSVQSRYFKEYLVESNGEILLIFLISRKSVNIVDDIEVFQLDIDKLLWVKMERIGDRTLFLGTNCCISICASKVGSKSDCVYFSNNKSVKGWWVYDFEAAGSISSCLSDGILPQICRVSDPNPTNSRRRNRNRLASRVFS
ncbi:hypothetical protein LWI29_009674 [Acer saccharum]|uniref:KIB1-4 beta-propeller domain-containing protein n=1 Tax=Acer saccharum TaxID=4024 RepID=A0AA39VKG2_ACESA|nr:hypothetical protein LWI29_009674 [Acer saccharum]